MASHPQENGRALFVYYKVELGQRAALLPVLESFVTRIGQALPEVSLELMQRPAASAEGKETWMEIYRLADGINDEMIAAIGRIAQETGMAAPRLSEVFVPLQTKKSP